MSEGQELMSLTISWSARHGTGAVTGSKSWQDRPDDGVVVQRTLDQLPGWLRSLIADVSARPQEADDEA